MRFFDANNNFINQYKGLFQDDKADGFGTVEDSHSNLFQVETGNQEKGKDSGCIINGRL